MSASEPAGAPSAVPVMGDTLFNPLDPLFRTDPVPIYKQLMAEGPIHRTPIGGVVLTRHSDCLYVLEHPSMSHDPRNSELFSALDLQNPYDDQMVERRRSFLFMDPPDHTRLRGLVSKAFTHKSVMQLRARVQEVVDELIDGVEGKGSMDLIDEIAYPLPVKIIAEMMGVPAEDGVVFREWSRVLARSLDPNPMVEPKVLESRVHAATEFREYFIELIAKRRLEPRDDLLSALVSAEEQGDKLTQDELLATLILLLIAGHETTVNLIGNGVLALLRNRDQFERLGSEPSLAKSCVEEVLRYDPPVMFTGRVAMEEVDLNGTTIPERTQIMTLIGAANRDPAVFADPGRFDIGRTPNPHLAFGMGIHFCLGAPLARLEGEVALATLARRLPSMTLRTGTPEYKENIVLRGLAALPVGW